MQPGCLHGRRLGHVKPVGGPRTDQDSLGQITSPDRLGNITVSGGSWQEGGLSINCDFSAAYYQ